MKFKDYMLIVLFVRLIDKKIKITFEDTYCWAERDNHAINIAPSDFRSITDFGFVRHIKTNHSFNKIDNYSLAMISILHEIGHLYTNGKDDLEMRSFLAMVSPEIAAKNINIQNKYFNIPCEWQATEWAINFIKRNQKFVKKFDKKFRAFS